MGCSGYINWHRLDRTLGWVKNRSGYHTYVYAFWLADYSWLADRGHSRDAGVAMFKDHPHPDWFVHSETADHILVAFTPPDSYASPNVTDVFENNTLASRPLLGSLLLGTSDTVYLSEQDQYWWAHRDDLTWIGRRVLKALDRLYEREPVLVTFVDAPTDESGSPRDS